MSRPIKDEHTEYPHTLGAGSLTLGFIGLLFFHLIFGPLSIILGGRAVKQNRGKQLGKLAIIVGGVDIVIGVVYLLLT
jgi:hypothetical protein